MLGARLRFRARQAWGRAKDRLGHGGRFGSRDIQSRGLLPLRFASHHVPIVMTARCIIVQLLVHSFRHSAHHLSGLPPSIHVLYPQHGLLLAVYRPGCSFHLWPRRWFGIVGKSQRHIFRAEDAWLLPLCFTRIVVPASTVMRQRSGEERSRIRVGSEVDRRDARWDQGKKHCARVGWDRRRR